MTTNTPNTNNDSNTPTEQVTETSTTVDTQNLSRSELRRQRQTDKTATDSKRIRFMRFQKPLSILSVILVIICLSSIVFKGLNLGLDFTGGVSAEVLYDQPVDQSEVTQTLSDAGFTDPVVQYLGSQRELLIRMNDQPSEDLSARLTKTLQAQGTNVEIAKIDAVGSKVGNQLYLSSLGALALALTSMMVYVAVRFEIKLAVGALISLVHDVVITVGLFSLFGLPFDLTVLAAILALIGYSLNDTIVVFDRIRENFRKIRGAEAREVVDISLTETLRRTIMTSVTVMVVVAAMLLLGGDGLHWFSVALMIGLIVGTYSSVYIASSYALAMNLSRQDFVVQVKPEFEEEVVNFEQETGMSANQFDESDIGVDTMDGDVYEAPK